MPALGAGDSGFESLHPDNSLIGKTFSVVYCKYMNKHSRSIVTILLLGGVVIGIALVSAIIWGQKRAIAPQEEQVQQSIVSSSGKLVVDNLTQNQVVTLPMVVTGTVQTWFFEGSFPVLLKDANGSQLAVALASSPVDWMTADPIPFIVTLPAVNYTGPGTITFKKDNPSGEPQFDDELVVNVVF